MKARAGLSEMQVLEVGDSSMGQAGMTGGVGWSARRRRLAGRGGVGNVVEKVGEAGNRSEREGMC
ncbi:hypothetical protein [Salmonella enterica]|uniref:hypothetical protein n=1 Tax=Salmonella enterica TaxID=28901 RepID=UPI00398C6FA8